MQSAGGSRNSTASTTFLTSQATARTARRSTLIGKCRGRTIDTDRFLILHEEVEKTLIDQLGLHYLHAHQIATRAEEAAVRAAGIEWRAYDRFMQKYVKTIGNERLTKVPKDLDLKPYRDEQDDDLLRRMLKSVHAGKAPKGIHVHDLAEAIRELRRRVRWHDTPGAHRGAAIKAKKNTKKPAKKKK